MTSKERFTFWSFIIVVTVLLVTFFSINRRLNQTTEAINAEFGVRHINLSREVPILAPPNQVDNQVAVTAAISVIGAPTSRVSKVKQEENKGKDVYQLQGLPTGTQNKGSSGGAGSNVSGSIGSISVKKNPSGAEKKEMDTKGVIIF